MQKLKLRQNAREVKKINIRDIQASFLSTPFQAVTVHSFSRFQRATGTSDSRGNSQGIFSLARRCSLIAAQDVR